MFRVMQDSKLLQGHCIKTKAKNTRSQLKRNSSVLRRHVVTGAMSALSEHGRVFPL